MLILTACREFSIERQDSNPHAGNNRIEFFFIGLNLLTLLAAWLTARIWYRGVKV